MSLVKPPTFDELVRLYGSPKKAIEHLAKMLSQEEIEHKYNIPTMRSKFS